MANALRDAYKEVADCDDYISRTADPPAYDPATMALLMNGIFDNTPLVDIDLPASAKTMFWAIFMTPDSKYPRGALRRDLRKDLQGQDYNLVQRRHLHDQRACCMGL